jgi:hypothetical protein
MLFLCLFMVRKWTHYNGNFERDLIMLQPRSYMLNYWCYKSRWFISCSNFLHYVEIERGKFFKMYNFLCLGLGENIIGLCKCVLILCNIETTKGSYIHESKLKEIWSLKCALEIKVTIEKSGRICIPNLSKWLS